MAKHIESLDILKGIIILLVLIRYAVQGVVSSQHLTISTEYSSIFILKQIIYGFYMPLFLVIAGLFIFSWSKKILRKPFHKRYYG